jgi:hypothetical protein
MTLAFATSRTLEIAAERRPESTICTGGDR